jgi:hypothetical protein
MASIKYSYSLSYSLATLLVMVVLMLLLLSNVAAGDSNAAWMIYGVFVLVFVAVGTLLIAKRLLPAIQGKAALELNETCLIDYLRNITIDWKDVKTVEFIRSRSSSLVQLNLKWVSDYGSEIAIPLRFVKGKDEEIYSQVQTCLEQFGSDIIL